MSRLMEYLPPYYVDSKQMTALLMAQEMELDNIAAGVLRQRNDMFIMTASSTAIRRRERCCASRLTPLQSRWIFAAGASLTVSRLNPRLHIVGYKHNWIVYLVRG
ncbi:hypothetical protein [Paenibacillus sp. 1A_MP2]|uniref:hypothetical protein n=1 Tax=Paenibacillus sp. 1A_MP2 TaxID=3457495 RepID=UPI003FCCFA8A